VALLREVFSLGLAILEHIPTLTAHVTTHAIWTASSVVPHLREGKVKLDGSTALPCGDSATQATAAYKPADGVGVQRQLRGQALTVKAPASCC